MSDQNQLTERRVADVAITHPERRTATSDLRVAQTEPSSATWRHGLPAPVAPIPAPNRRKATVDRRADVPPVTPDLDAEDLRSRVSFAKPRNEAVIKDAREKLGAAQRLITEASEGLDAVVHVEVPK